MQDFGPNAFRSLKLVAGFSAFFLLSQCELIYNNQDIRELSPQKAAEKIQNEAVKVLDVRTGQEYQQGHIPEAINIDYKSDTFNSAIQALSKAQPYLIYCAAGKRSFMAAKRMKLQGFQSVSHLKDGIHAWQNAGLPSKQPDSREVKP